MNAQEYAAERSRLEAAMHHAALGVHFITGRTDQSPQQIVELHPDNEIVKQYLAARQEFNDFVAKEKPE